MTRTTLSSVQTGDALYEASARGDIATVIGAMDERYTDTRRLADVMGVSAY